jgi:hypothetical protein
MSMKNNPGKFIYGVWKIILQRIRGYNWIVITSYILSLEVSLLVYILLFRNRSIDIDWKERT